MKTRYFRFQASIAVASELKNKEKNRFNNILPYDHSRVLLDNSDGRTDYINACYIHVS